MRALVEDTRRPRVAFGWPYHHAQEPEVVGGAPGYELAVSGYVDLAG